MGFFYDYISKGHSRDLFNYYRKLTMDGVFKDNVAHSIFQPTGGNDRYPPRTRGYGLFVNTFDLPKHQKGSLTFENFSAYKVSVSGVWTESKQERIKGLVVSDSGTGIVLFRSYLEDSLFVRSIRNEEDKIKNVGTTPYAGAINFVREQIGGFGPFAPKVDGVTIVGYKDGNVGVGLLDYRPSSTDTDDTYFRKMTFIDTPVRFKFQGPSTQRRDIGANHRDGDGSLSGFGQPGWVVMRESQLWNSSCIEVPESQGFFCPDK